MRAKGLRIIVLLCTLSLLCGCTGNGVQGTTRDMSYAGISPSVEQTEKYMYETLCDSDKHIYEQVLECVMSHDKSVRLNCDLDTLGRIYYCVRRDHGEIFWVDGYNYTSRESSVVFEPVYSMDYETRCNYSYRVSTIVSRLVTKYKDLSDYEKVKAVYEYIIKNIEYDELSVNNQNILGVFLDRGAVCLGSANAVQTVLSRLGVDSIVITGETELCAHAWNLVKIEGEWYHLDITAGMLAYNTTKYVDYRYMTMTDEETYLTRSTDSLVMLPECNNTTYEYFRQEGLYFDKDDLNQIIKIAKQGYAERTNCLALRFATLDDLEFVRDELIQENLREHITDLDRIRYSVDEDFCVMILDFSESN